MNQSPAAARAALPLEQRAIDMAQPAGTLATSVRAALPLEQLAIDMAQLAGTLAFHL